MQQLILADSVLTLCYRTRDWGFQPQCGSHCWGWKPQPHTNKTVPPGRVTVWEGCRLPTSHRHIPHRVISDSFNGKPQASDSVGPMHALVAYGLPLNEACVERSDVRRRGHRTPTGMTSTDWQPAFRSPRVSDRSRGVELLASVGRVFTTDANAEGARLPGRRTIKRSEGSKTRPQPS